jgi:sugar lactone lactonase YvrE
MTQHPLKPFGPPGHFYEGPRWRDGRWWVSDMQGRAVYSLSPDGEAREELRLDDDSPSGLGWLPDGTLIVVSMNRRLLLYRPAVGGDAKVYADLAPLCGDSAGYINDMGISRDGHAYVGFDTEFNASGTTDDPGLLLHVDPRGKAEIAARGLFFPNGVVFTPDGSTLVVAETMQPRFSGFPIGADGRLGPAFTWAGLDPKRDLRPDKSRALGSEPVGLDGCVMDAEGHIWAADLRSCCLRVAPGGDIVDAIFLPGEMHPWACALGGEDGKALLICGADMNFKARMAAKGSQLYITTVGAPGVEGG